MRTKKIRTEPVWRMYEKTLRDGTKREVKEYKVGCYFCSASFESTMEAFEAIVECIRPLREAWVGTPRMEEGYPPMRPREIPSFGRFLRRGEEFQARVPFDEKKPPKIYVDRFEFDYETASGRARIILREYKRWYIIKARVWHESCDLISLLDALDACGISAGVVQESVDESWVMAA